MYTPQKSAICWINFVLFELLCLMICFIAVGAALKLGVFNDDFIRSGGFWKATFALFGLWFVLSSAALIHRIWGLGLGAFITGSALIAPPFSALIFCAGFSEGEGVFFLLWLASLSTLLGLCIALAILKAAEALEDWLYSVFRLLGF